MMIFSKRKWLMFALVAIFVVGLMASAEADGPMRFSKDQLCNMYVLTNADGDFYQTTSISTSTIIPGRHRILGFSIGAYNTSLNSEFDVGLYDATSLQAATALLDNVFDEAELDADNYGRLPMFYPYPRKIANGLTVRQGTNTIVIIFYEDITEF